MQAGICFLVSIEWWSSPVRLIASIIAGWRELASGRSWWSLAPLAVARFGVVGPTRARREAAPGEGSGSGARVHPPPIVAGAASIPGIRGRSRSVFQATKGGGSRRPARRAPLAGRGGPDCVRPAFHDPAKRLHPPGGIWTLGGRTCVAQRANSETRSSRAGQDNPGSIEPAR
jgi:hypothetical protein